MKKLIGLLIAGSLMSAAAVPAMATNASYPTGGTGYFDVDYINYAGSGKTVKEFFQGDRSKLSNYCSNYAEYADSEMGYTVAKLTEWGTSGMEYGRVDMNTRYTNGFSAGDRFFMEMSMKVLNYGSPTNSANTVLQFGAAGTDTNMRLFELTSSSKIQFKAGSTYVNKDYSTNEWMHMVFEFVPGESDGTVIAYYNGEKVLETTSSTCKLSYFNSSTWSANRLYTANDAVIAVSKFRAWKSTSSYDAAAAGDTANIITSSAGVLIDSSAKTVQCAGMTTLADLNAAVSEQNGGSIAYLDGSGNEISDMTTNVSGASKLVVRSASRDYLKVYTLSVIDVASGVYTISGSTISGVMEYTSPAILKSNLLTTYAVTTDHDSDAYIPNGTVVTINGTNYTVSLASDASLTKNNLSNTTATTDTDALKGSVTKLTMGNSATYRITPGGDHNTRKLNAGETRNVEFSIKSDGTHSSWLIIDDNVPIRFATDGYLYYATSGSQYGQQLCAYPINEWMHIAVSALRDSTRINYRIYVNGEYLGSYYSYNTPSAKTRFDFMTPSDSGTRTVWFDDFRVYYSAQQIFDADTVYGATAPTTAYNVEDGEIYVPRGVNDEDIAVTFPADASLLNSDGSAFTGDFSVGSTVYVRDRSGVIIKKYSFVNFTLPMTLNGSTVSVDISPLGSGEEPILHVVQFDGTGRFVNVTTVTEAENNTLSAALTSGYTNKVLIWNSSINPYVAPTTYVEQNGVWTVR